jgi:hypothetical protein
MKEKQNKIIEKINIIIRKMDIPEEIKQKWYDCKTTEDRRDLAIGLYVKGYLD